MTNKEIQASDEELQKFNISQNEKCISEEKEKVNRLMNKISFALKDATLQQGFEIICKRLKEYESGEVVPQCYMNETISQNLELKKENEELKYALGCEMEERGFVEHQLDLVKTGDEYRGLQDLCSCYKKENEELKAKLYSDSKNVFAELNDETAKSNAELLDMVEDLKAQIEKMKCCENCKFRQDACDAYCNIAKQHDFCKDEKNCPVFKLQEENERLQKVILEQNILNIDLMGENERLEKICDFNCPVHKLATHNTCLTCPAVRNSPHHDLKNVSDEELQKIIKEAEAEMEM